MPPSDEPVGPIVYIADCDIPGRRPVKRGAPFFVQDKSWIRYLFSGLSEAEKRRLKIHRLDIATCLLTKLPVVIKRGAVDPSTGEVRLVE